MRIAKVLSSKEAGFQKRKGVITLLEKILRKIRSWQRLPKEFQELLSAAEKAMENGYAPRSGFLVGAAVLDESGEIITGSNYEMMASTVSVCAERAAVVNANSRGYWRLRAIATIARGRDSPTRKVTLPCGSCLQMLAEAAQRASYDLEVILSTTHRDAILVTRISKLLPSPFLGTRNLLESGAREEVQEVETVLAETNQ